MTPTAEQMRPKVGKVGGIWWVRWVGPAGGHWMARRKPFFRWDVAIEYATSLSAERVMVA